MSEDDDAARDEALEDAEDGVLAQESMDKFERLLTKGPGGEGLGPGLDEGAKEALGPGLSAGGFDPDDFAATTKRPPLERQNSWLPISLKSDGRRGVRWRRLQRLIAREEGEWG
mmetsp:Transcript_35313/g.85169  ORF Transcript_35313/g.85169 Transcript_35313/m.85169 type:complete len:114 (-) Transcript_35313:497-838(-)